MRREAGANLGGTALSVPASERYRIVATPLAQSVDARPATSGLGILVGLGLGLSAGVAEGITTLWRTPSGVLSAGSSVLVFFHCAAVLVTAGLVVGVIQEIVLAAARRRPGVVALGHFVADGPRAWFAADARASLRLLVAAVYAAVALGPVAPGAGRVIGAFHTKSLMAPAIVVVVAGSQIFAALVAVVVAWPLGALLKRASVARPPIVTRLASPGAALSLMGLAIVAAMVRVGPVIWQTLLPGQLVPAFVGAGLVIADIAALLIAGVWLLRRGRPARRRIVVGAVGLALAAFAISGVTFGARQNVASTIFMESEVTAPVAHALQLAIDLDHDGYSALFGGGDCNDLDPSVHPGALDVPGDGIDQDCSGADARWLDESGDGYPKAVTGPLAGVSPSFVLLSIDALRADHVGAYGYGRPTTPNLDRFAQGAARFTRAYCTSPYTLVSIASIWTGRYSSNMAFGQDERGVELSEENVSLASELSDDGYASTALSNSDFFHRRAGMLRGFSEWREPEHGEAKGDVGALVSNLSQVLRERADDPRAFFVWAHMIEPHDPYRRWTTPQDFGAAGVDRYDEEIARADEALGSVLRVVDEVAVKRPVIVVIFADHGEAFGEHGYRYHASDLHEEQTRVPLLVRGPGIPPGERSALTSLLDLHPTILDYAGLHAARPIDGRSLVGVLQAPAGGPAPAGWRDHLYTELVPKAGVAFDQKAVLAPPWKLIVDVRHGLLELYDLDRDPRELRNVFDDEPARGAALREQLLSWAATTEQKRSNALAAARTAGEPAHMSTPLRVRFGDVVDVLGCDLPAGPAHPRDTLHMVCHLRALRRTDVPYRFRVDLLADDGGPSPPGFSARHFPVNGSYPTTAWSRGVLVRDDIDLDLGRGVRATGYSVELRVEDAVGHEPLLPTGDVGDRDAVVIGHFELLP